MTISKFSTWTFVVLLLISFVLVAHLLFGFVTPMVMALVIVSLFHSLHTKTLKLLKNREYCAAGLSTFIVVLCMLIPIVLFFIALVNQIITLYQASQALKQAGQIANWIRALDKYLLQLAKHLSEYGINIMTEPIINLSASISKAFGKILYDIISSLAANLLSICFNFLLTVVLVFIFFVSGRPVKNFVMDLVPIPNEDKQRLVTRFRELASAVFIGNGMISAVEGVFGGLLFYLFDVPGALIWAVAIAVTGFLPIVGASVVVIPASIYVFLVSETWVAILFAVLNTIGLLVLESWVKPNLIGTKSQMHAVLVFLSVLSGVQIYGVFGLFYGPLLVTMFLSLAQIYKEHYRNILLKNTQI